MKNLVKILAASFLLPGFIFDMCMGVAFILNDGRSDHHVGDFIAKWAIGVASALPDFMDVPLLISCFVCALPAGAICIALVIGCVLGLAYLMLCVMGSIIQLPFTGKLRWVNITDLTD